MYVPGEYDLAGFAVGVVEKSQVIDGTRIAAGDVVLGLASSGPHSNGFSLIRRILELPAPTSRNRCSGIAGSRTLGDALLAPTRIYVKPLLARDAEASTSRAWRTSPAAACSRTCRACFPTRSQARIERARWPRPAIFDWLQRAGNVADAEMHRVFNCGIGMVVVVAPADAERAIALLTAARRDASFRIGDVVPRARARPAPSSSSDASDGPRHGHPAHHRPDLRPRLEPARAARRRCAKARSTARSPRVISNRAAMPALDIAATHGVPAIVVDTRVSRSARRSTRRWPRRSTRREPDLVVLAGFMRVLGPAFVGRYEGRMLNIHPSLLPSYPGLHTHRRALADGVRIHGCTVHFVTAAVDLGPIVAQGAVAVRDDDDEASLAARVLAVEHRLLPAAVRAFCAGRLVIDGSRVHVKHERVPSAALEVPTPDS